MTAPLADAEARRAIREDLDATLVVEAAAGTGKTTEMIARIIAVLRTGTSTLERIVAMTFTEKAAGEMKLRLRTELERARRGATGVERERLQAALAELEVARIGTIHSFCADLLRERPLEARVDPLFAVTAEDEAERLYDRAFDAWLLATLGAPGEGVRRLLRRTEAIESLRRAGWSRIGRRDFAGAWRRDPFTREAALDGLLAALADFAAAAGTRDALGTKLQRWLDELARREHVRPRDHDGLEAELGGVGRWWEWRRGSKVAGLRDAARAELTRVLEACDADLAACLHAELASLVTEYERLKAQGGSLDFLDLLVCAKDLLATDPRVRAEMCARFTHFFVDEFQDTDPLQVEILELLCAEGAPGKLFVVGDPKQAIYRFRRADIALYETVTDRLVAQGARRLNLTTSFRSVPAIQAVVNAAFEPVMRGHGQASYVPLQPFRDGVDSQPAVVALPVPEPYSKVNIANKAIEASYPEAVGAYVAWLVNESGWSVSERGAAERVAIAPRHICLLFRRFHSYGNDLTRGYARALETRSIKHVLVGGRSFHAREEVEATRIALQAIEWPDDEFAVYGTLRGPFFGFHDEDLVAFRHLHRRLSPLRWLTAELPVVEDAAAHARAAAIVDALRILAGLHRERNRRAIADTLARLFAATRAHAGLALWPAGEQALANVFRVLEHARRFEATGATSFRAFVDRLDADAEHGRHSEAPVVEAGTEGVRIMTVHTAKGLEFPVVILCDPTAPLAQSKPSRYIDNARHVWLEPLAGCVPSELREHAEEVLRRDREEGERLAYVAATRARELLVVPVLGDEEPDNWLAPLVPAVYPDAATKRTPQVAPACPPFGDDSVVSRPEDAAWNVSAVSPGLHTPRAGTHTVVWWDPRALQLETGAPGGLRQHELLVADDSATHREAGARMHAEWVARHTAAITAGTTPSLVVQRATDLETAPPDGVVEEATTGGSHAGRPRGRRFGSLVHAILATLDYSSPGDLDRLAANQARLVGAPPAERDAAIPAVRTALTHPLLVRAAAAATRGDLRREVPVVLATDTGIIEGVVDLAFREADRWIVVELKTDVDLAASRDRYRAQVLAYARAIAAATGLATSAAILAV